MVIASSVSLANSSTPPPRRLQGRHERNPRSSRRRTFPVSYLPSPSPEKVAGVSPCGRRLRRGVSLRSGVVISGGRLSFSPAQWCNRGGFPRAATAASCADLALKLPAGQGG
ncbi:hypothetical protein VPH35_010883 [Triticum aestivum]